MRLLTTIMKACATVAVVLIAGGAVLLVLLYWVPSFVVRNASGEDVTVHAHWRDQHKLIGTLAPEREIEFSLGDEAAMRFEVQYASGRVARSEPIELKSGVRVIATITDTRVQVAYDD